MKIPEVFTVDGPTNGLPVVDFFRVKMVDRGNTCPFCFSYLLDVHRLVRDTFNPQMIGFVSYCACCRRALIPFDGIC